METFATSRENTALKVDDEAISMIWKEYPVWEARAEHIKRILFNGNDRIMTVEVFADGEQLSHEIDLPKKSYEEVRSLFTEKLDGVQISSLSTKRQLILPFSLMAFVILVTGILSLFAIERATAPESATVSETGIFKTFFYYLADQFGTSGILLGGALGLGVIGLFALKRYFFPKRASIVTFHYGDRMMIFRDEEDILKERLGK